MSLALRQRLDPEDVAQEVLLAVHRDFASFRGDDPKAFFRWFWTVAENRVRDVADYHGALKRRSPEPATFSQTSPSKAAVRREQATLVLEAVAGLPDAHREVIRLVRVEERPVAEVAALLGKTPNAVRILYCRALKELRLALARLGSSVGGTLPEEGDPGETDPPVPRSPGRGSR
jgi:RNA polymerase sigma-70 factor (ECF subfamily)